MELKINTLELQLMVSKAIKGASNNKMIPITGLIAIILKDNNLTLITTDASNTLKIMANGIEGDDFYATVQAETFSKLVLRTTSKDIKLILKDNNLEVKGNGVYNIELPLDEEGQIIKFPETKIENEVELSSIHLSTIKSMLATNKAALAETMEMPCLTAYYCDNEKILTTDTFKVCGNKIGMFETPKLLSSELVELLSLMDNENIKVYQDGNKLLFKGENIEVYGSLFDGIEDYPVEAIQKYLETDFNNSCEIVRATLLKILDRLMLFVSPYDKNAIYLNFTQEGIIIKSKKTNGTELIEYVESNNFEPYSCSVDIELLNSQLSAQTDENVELWYGHDRAIKMVNGNITQIVSLLQEDIEMEDN